LNLEYSKYKILLLIGCFIITTLHSIALNNLIYDKDVIKKPNFVLAFVFILITTPFGLNMKMLIYSIVMLLFLQCILKLYKQQFPYSSVFNASIIISFLSFFIPNILLLYLLIIISLIIFRNIKWRLIIIPILGIIIPYLFIWTYQIFYSKTLFFPEINFSINSIELYNLETSVLIWIGVVALIMLLSILEIFVWMFKKSIRSRESFSIILFYFFLTLLLSFFSENNDIVILLMIPSTIIITNYFVYHKNKKWSSALFLIFVFSSIFYRISMINL
tara:strand:- start:25690 stop:26514 length:825 start_codon:yes stop_codon:yes gene_type:complete